MAHYQIIADFSSHLLQLVRGAVCPGLLPYPEQIALCAPGDKNTEAMLCVYLYTLRDFSPYVPQAWHGGAWEGPSPLAISLGYVLFTNPSAQSPLDPLAEQRLLGCVIDAVRQNPLVEPARIHEGATMLDEPASLSFERLEDREKQELWSGFSQPLRPAVYLEAGPLLIGGGDGEPPRVAEFQGRLY